MKLPKTHTAVVAIRDANDAESIAAAAAAASLSLLTKVSAEQRAAVVIDHVSITQPEGLGASTFGDMLTASIGLPDLGRYSVVVTARLKDAETKPEAA